MARTAGDPLNFAVAIQKEIGALDPQLPVVDVLTISQIVGESTLNESFAASLVLIFAALSLVLAGVGLYGVLSYVVTQRVPEIGIRIALGAQRGQVLGMVLRDGMRPGGDRIVVYRELPRAAGWRYVIRSQLYGTSSDGIRDRLRGDAVAMLLVVAATASAAPAWRASSVNPIEALRAE